VHRVLKRKHLSRTAVSTGVSQLHSPIFNDEVQMGKWLIAIMVIATTLLVLIMSIGVILPEDHVSNVSIVVESGEAGTLVIAATNQELLGGPRLASIAH
jgi:hypothetical protein